MKCDIKSSLPGFLLSQYGDDIIGMPPYNYDNVLLLVPQLEPLISIYKFHDHPKDQLEVQISRTTLDAEDTVLMEKYDVLQHLYIDKKTEIDAA